jgi:hypothetical protein
LLYDSDGNTFFQGVSSFTIQPVPPSNPRALRIVVPVGLEGNYTQAVVDTGGIYFICNADLASLLAVDLSAAVGKDTIFIRGKHVSGHLYRFTLELVATHAGNSITLEATTFVPDEPTEWDLPPYIGFHGCLERFRFAVDPGTELFYFGYGEF